jgi:bifunctional UDP-N-acetylglucosamine pyrophosphorylase/glucosamine-1-phosphate N-acetyltransferase
LEPLPNIAAVVLAAGESKRFRSARSKLVHPFAERPLIRWSVDGLRRIGAAPLVVVVGHDADGVRAAAGSGIVFAVQSEQRGTGHAALAAREALAGFAGDVVVLNGDLPRLRAETLHRLVETHRATSGVLSMLTATVDDPSGWGRIVRRRGAIVGIVEDRDADAGQRAIREVNVGVYCAAPGVLFSLLERVSPDNVQGEIYLTDVVGRAVEAGLHVAGVDVESVEVGQINSRKELAAMEKSLHAEINARWMDAGVTLEDPDTTYIGPEVTIGRDSVIGPNVHLRGRTVIGEACRLDGSSFLTEAKLGDRVHLRFGVVMTESEAGAGCQIGPFAHLRPGTRLAAEVHIGDFVETKNAVVGPRTKANHLAYLGDAEIGSDSNIGAGTITCNYDGFAKHRTIIGNRVQIGSDSQLVAPVTVEDDVYVASGTTVRRNAPAGCLVFNTRPEMQRAGWVAAFRARKTGPDVSAAPSKPATKRRAKTARASKGSGKTARKPKPARRRAARRRT